MGAGTGKINIVYSFLPIAYSHLFILYQYQEVKNQYIQLRQQKKIDSFGNPPR